MACSNVSNETCLKITLSFDIKRQVYLSIYKTKKSIKNVLLDFDIMDFKGICFINVPKQFGNIFPNSLNIES